MRKNSARTPAADVFISGYVIELLVNPIRSNSNICGDTLRAHSMTFTVRCVYVLHFFICNPSQLETQS